MLSMKASEINGVVIVIIYCLGRGVIEETCIACGHSRIFSFCFTLPSVFADLYLQDQTIHRTRPVVTWSVCLQ